MTTQGTCAACQRAIDAAAKLCPFCGADPQTGERVDTQALLQEVFQPKDLSTSENVMEFARQRQGIVVAVSILVGFLVLAALHQFATVRNSRVATGTPAIPLTEITDVTRRGDDVTPVEMPPLDFFYDGRPQAMRTYIAEGGATTPPEVAAAQQQPPAASPEARPPQQPIRPLTPTERARQAAPPPAQGTTTRPQP
jgi:hypothetical protein